MQPWLLIREATTLWPGHQALWAVPPVLEGGVVLPPAVWRPSWLACQPGQSFWYIPNPVFGNEVICHSSTLWGLGCVSFKALAQSKPCPIHPPPAYSVRGKDAIFLGDMF